MFESKVYERYQRQLILKGFGEKAQEQLFNARVLVVGAGGLGCPVLQYLAAAGVGRISIIDDDVVALSNLHRQLLYNTEDVGKPKVICATEQLKKLNPMVWVTAYNERLTSTNALQILCEADIIVDGSDNFETRYLVNDACVLLDKPLIYGAVSQYEGQVAVWNIPAPDGTHSTNYRDLFPQSPAAFSVPNCSEAGVLGVLPAVIGCMMAAEAIKIITGTGSVLMNRLLNYNLLSQQFYEMEIEPLSETRKLIPADAAAFRQMHYAATCSGLQEITPAEFDKLLAAGTVQVIDVREPGEMPVVTAFQAQPVPMSGIEHIPALTEKEVVVFCQSGQRSMRAVQQLTKKFKTTCRIRSLKGGLVAWLDQQKTKST